MYLFNFCEYFIDRRLDSDGSKDSSIDSGTESRNYSDIRRELTSATKVREFFQIIIFIQYIAVIFEKFRPHKTK